MIDIFNEKILLCNEDILHTGLLQTLVNSLASNIQESGLVGWLSG